MAAAYCIIWGDEWTYSIVPAHTVSPGDRMETFASKELALNHVITTMITLRGELNTAIRRAQKKQRNNDQRLCGARARKEGE